MIEKKPFYKHLLGWSLLFNLPPALTLLSNLSILYFLGPISEWLQAYWLPITREFWTRIFDLLGGINLSASAKDYLTAIVFFLPAFLLSRRKSVSVEETSKALRWIAYAVSPILLYILVEDSWTDLDMMANSVLSIGMLAFGLFVFVLMIGSYERLIRRTRDVDDTLPDHRHPGFYAFRVIMWLLIVMIGACFVYDALVLLTNPFPPMDYDLFTGFFTQTAPTRSFFLTLFLVVVIFLFAPASAKARLKKPKAEKETEGKGNQIVLGRFWALMLFIGVPAAFYSLFALSVGWVETALCLTLIFIVISIVIRTPLRIIMIAKAFAILLASTYVIWGISEAKDLLEGFTQLAPAAT